jgi:SAM-dependent methyltransferase
MESVPCPLCGGEHHRALVVAGDRLRPGDRARYRVVRCTDCGLAFTDPRPSADEMAAFYPTSYGGLEEDDLVARLEAGFRRRQQREVVRWLTALRPGRGRLLDAGCGAGDLLAVLRDDGWEVAGLEAAPRAAELARRRHGLEVTTGRFEDADLARATFDVVVLAGVLEHLHDPLGALRTARALLRAGGLVAVLFVPRLDSPEARRFGRRWLALDLPRHLTHFEEATFTRMVAAADLGITHREPYSSRHSPAQLVGSVAPGLQKHRFYARETAGRPSETGVAGAAAAALTPLARRAAFITLTTAARPWCRLEAAAARGAVCSYFLEPTG